MTNCWLHGACLAGLAALACTAHAQGPYPGNGDLLEPDYGYPYREKRIYHLVYPPEIFDYCVELYGIRGSRAEQCMRNENKQKREAETLLQGEVGNPQVRKQIYAKCFAEWGEKGMKWVNHCVHTEVSYHQIHSR